MKEQLLLLADLQAPRRDTRGWFRQEAAPGWIGTCRCAVVLAIQGFSGFTCVRCRKPTIAAPYQVGLVSAYLIGGWSAVAELAAALYCELPA